MSMRKVVVAIGLAGLGAVVAGEAKAGAFGIREQSVIGLGGAFAGAASGAAGLSSMFWNPATITMRPGWNTEFNATYIDPSAQLRTFAPTPTLPLGQAGDIGLSGVIPASYSAYQLTDSLWIGLISTAPYGLITKPRTVWAGQTYSRSSRVFSASFSPVVGYKVNDMLSIAIGPTIEYLKVRLNQAVSVSPFAPNAILEGDDVGGGLTAGVTIKPFAGTTIGVGYRSTIHHVLAGTLRSFLPPPLAVPNVFPAAVKLNMPDQVNVGITQAITPDFDLNFGFEWANWSRLKSPAVVLLPGGGPLTAVALGYKDGYYFSLGGEYRWGPQWTLRAGVGYEISPIDVTNRATRVPDTDRVHANVGVSYKWSEKLELSVSYAHLFAVGNRQIRIVPGNIVYNGLPFFGDVRPNVNIVGASFTYRWDNPRVAEAAPIIRKY